ncbi:hypothetical protein FQA47_012446 [Oryzias melastigma]|uniref:Uncharacterized protein n=1 Tax=Oryzias melastigma TaxID=30732 RepID=A0A834C095_ORYME|nr:hypothetical protein FQA47_012446 [Oryzias melastigma]
MTKEAICMKMSRTTWSSERDGLMLHYYSMLWLLWIMWMMLEENKAEFVFTASLWEAGGVAVQSRKKGTNMRKGIETEGMRVWGCVKVSMCSLKEKKRREGAREGESCTPVSKDLLTK